VSIVYIVTGSISVITGIVGGFVLRQHIARLDERDAARRDGSFLEIGERPIAGIDRSSRKGV